MNNKAVIVFFTTVLLLYTVISYYIYTRGLQSLPHLFTGRKYFKIIFILLTLSPVIGKTLERVWISPLSEFFLWIGYFWLGMIIFLFLIILVLDLVRLINYIIPFYPSSIKDTYETVKFVLSIIITSGIVLILLIGYINAISPRIKNLNFKIDKYANGMSELNMVAVSDLHLGTTVNKRRTISMVSKINKLNPDIVTIVGDIVDDNMQLVKHYDLLKYFKNIKSQFGIYAITGNHEYISEAYKDFEYYSDNNILLLKDSVIKVNDSFYLIGRDDIEGRRFANINRKPLHELLDKIDDTFPVILLDHQPFKLDEVAKNNIDVQLSGHTHHGQFWPLQYITKAIFEVSWGYIKKNNTHFYVSSGFGTSGPPIRLGNRPEILNIKLEFRKE